MKQEKFREIPALVFVEAISSAYRSGLSAKEIGTGARDIVLALYGEPQGMEAELQAELHRMTMERDQLANVGTQLSNKLDAFRVQLKEARCERDEARALLLAAESQLNDPSISPRTHSTHGGEYDRDAPTMCLECKTPGGVAGSLCRNVNRDSNLGEGITVARSKTNCNGTILTKATIELANKALAEVEAD